VQSFAEECHLAENFDLQVVVHELTLAHILGTPDDRNVLFAEFDIELVQTKNDC
jgi:hypothetical protein